MTTMITGTGTIEREQYAHIVDYVIELEETAAGGEVVSATLSAVGAPVDLPSGGVYKLVLANRKSWLFSVEKSEHVKDRGEVWHIKDVGDHNPFTIDD